MTIVSSQRAATSSQPEDMFVELFTQVFGLEKTQLLVPEHPVADIYGNQRFIDFALKSAGRLIAFEVDGPAHYGPPDFSLDKFEDDLLRQNSLIHQGWQVFRWSDRELAERAEQVKEQLSLFLESVPGLLEMDDFLPRQSGASIDAASPSAGCAGLAGIFAGGVEDDRLAGTCHGFRQNHHRHRRCAACWRSRALCRPP